MTGADDPVIVVTGEALIDIVLDRRGGITAHPGGGPYNVARTIGRLEQRVTYLGRLSTDAFGTRLRRELAADGVALDTVLPTDAPTTLALAEIGESGAAVYRFYTAATSAADLTLEAASAVLPSRIGMFYLGTLGLVLEPVATTLEALVDRIDDATLVALDPNCRPSVIQDPGAYRRRVMRLLRRSDCQLMALHAWIASAGAGRSQPPSPSLASRRRGSRRPSSGLSDGGERAPREPGFAGLWSRRSRTDAGAGPACGQTRARADVAKEVATLRRWCPTLK